MKINFDSTQYSKQGYVVRPHVLDDAILAPYQTSLDQMIANLKEGERPENLKEPHVNAADWQLWLELCRHPRVLDQVRAVLGDDLVLLMSHLIVKRPFDGNSVNWHQDNTYWASVDGTDVCTVWLAFDITNQENACMRVIPNSHENHESIAMVPADEGNLLSVKIVVPPELESKAVDLLLNPGDLSIHDSFIIHGSESNTSARRRAGYTMRYAKASTVKVDIPNHGKPVYYVSGSDDWFQEGMRDIRPGRPLPDHPGEHVSKNATTTLSQAK